MTKTKEKERLKIQLTDKYQVTADQYNYILQEKVISEKGEPYEKNIAYYGNLEHLVKGLLEREIKSSAVDRIEELEERFNFVVNELTKYYQKTFPNLRK